jgi:hypothetical protein
VYNLYKYINFGEMRGSGERGAAGRRSERGGYFEYRFLIIRHFLTIYNCDF